MNRRELMALLAVAPWSYSAGPWARTEELEFSTENAVWRECSYLTAGATPDVERLALHTFGQDVERHLCDVVGGVVAMRPVSGLKYGRGPVLDGRVVARAAHLVEGTAASALLITRRYERRDVHSFDALILPERHRGEAGA
ncbi:MAG: hypothetical protein VW405_00295 [Rhodospirillaceae bacterium]